MNSVFFNQTICMRRLILCNTVLICSFSEGFQHLEVTVAVTVSVVVTLSVFAVICYVAHQFKTTSIFTPQPDYPVMNRHSIFYHVDYTRGEHRLPAFNTVDYTL